MIAVLVAALLGLSTFGFWRFSVLKREKRVIDEHIRQVESRLARDETPQEAERLISELSTYQDEARSLERSVLYRYAVRPKESLGRRHTASRLSSNNASTNISNTIGGPTGQTEARICSQGVRRNHHWTQSRSVRIFG